MSPLCSILVLKHDQGPWGRKAIKRQIPSQGYHDLFAATSFLNSSSSSLRKETQLDKYVSHQAIKVFAK